MASTGELHSIVVLSTAPGYGGGERSLEELLVHLSADFRVHLVAENLRHEQNCRVVLRNGGTLSRLPAAPRPIQVLYGAFWTIFQSIARRPVFVLANTNKSGLILAVAALMRPSLRKRAVLYIRDFQWRLLTLIVRILSAGLVLIPSEAVLDQPAYLGSLLKKTGARLAVVPNMASLQQLSRSTRPLEATVVMLGAIQRWKGQQFLLQALSLLPSSVTAAFYGGVQDPDYFSELQQEITKLRLEDRVVFHPYTDNVSEVLSCALCVVVASVGQFGGPETFGRVVLDAWAASRPIVAFDIGGPHYLVRNEETGLLVPEGDWQALAGAIKRLSEEAGLAERLVSAGTVEVHARYGAKTIYDKFLSAMYPGRQESTSENRATQ